MTMDQMYIKCTYVSEVLRYGADESEDPYPTDYLTGPGLRAQLCFNGLAGCHVSETNKIIY